MQSLSCLLGEVHVAATDTLAGRVFHLAREERE
jgi:hypothetical protein